MWSGETRSFTIMLANKERIDGADVVGHWSRNQEFAVEDVRLEPHTHARLQPYVKWPVQNRHENLFLERLEAFK